MSKSKPIYLGKLTPEQIVEYKSLILDLLDVGGAKTLATAARAVGVSPTKVYDWNKSDNGFRNQVQQARKVLADKLIEELLDDTEAKMPQVVAKIFIIKGLCPEFRDSHRVVEFKDERGVKILEELRRLGREVPKEEPKVPSEPVNPLLDTVERINYA